MIKMALTNEDKADLRNEVCRLGVAGYSKKEAIDILHKKWLWKRATIAKYWKAINEKS